ncbi:MAG: single-stranded-DNA-specific exonuclease RecJ [Candidatus Scatovivens sp.]
MFGYTIPNRLEEGYGLNKEAVKRIKEEGYNLIITVDCGISGMEEIKYAYELGLEVIVTDHHEPLEELPNALAIIDCKRKDNKYPFKNLAGVGVVFKLIQAISIRMNLKEEEYLKYLDIVCIGTISDIVPLIDENRVIAKLGIKLVKVTKNIGLRVLLKTIGYKQINSNAISFGIAPRINACGRMGHAEDALKLFFTENEKEAMELTNQLNEYNRQRQEIEKRILEESLLKIEKEKIYEKSAIVIGSEKWHHGVIGIVASKITDMFYKPSILICFEGEEGKGSGRSIAGFDLHEALCKSSEELEKYGGHEMAVGLSLKRSKFDSFKEKFENIADNANINEMVSVIKVDKQINSKDVTFSLIENLKDLEPFGESNEMPIFIYKNLKIDSIRSFSEGKHLRLTLRDGNKLMNAIGFNQGHLSGEYTIGDKIDVLGILEINSYNGMEMIQINIKDVRKSY